MKLWHAFAALWAAFTIGGLIVAFTYDVGVGLALEAWAGAVGMWGWVLMVWPSLPRRRRRR